MENDRFKVLWFDDNPKVSFIDNAYISGIDITVAENLEKGLSLINSAHVFDAFIFDANYKKKDVDESSLVLSDLINEVAKITNDKTPWFVLTAGDFSGIEAISYIIPESIWEKELDTKRFYNKVGEDEDVLFRDIKNVVRKTNTLEWKLRNEHKEIYLMFNHSNNQRPLFDMNSESDLTRILIAFNSPAEHIIPDHFNTIRKFVAGEVFRVLTDIGVIPKSITQLNAKMYHLGDKRFSEHIPIYIQQSIFSLINVCQDGSHSGNEITDGKIPPIVERSIKTGKAPYLLQSIVLDLLTVLWWLKDFARYSETDKNLETFKLKEEPNNEINTNWIQGELTEISYNGWGKFLSLSCEWSIPPSMIKQYGFQVGDELEITTKAENNKHIEKIRKIEIK
jgi:hypothetical protein